MLADPGGLVLWWWSLSLSSRFSSGSCFCDTCVSERAGDFGDSSAPSDVVDETGTSPGPGVAGLPNGASRGTVSETAGKVDDELDESPKRTPSHSASASPPDDDVTVGMLDAKFYGKKANESLEQAKNNIHMTHSKPNSLSAQTSVSSMMSLVAGSL